MLAVVLLLVLVMIVNFEARDFRSKCFFFYRNLLPYSLFLFFFIFVFLLASFPLTLLSLA